jgi:diguanylate cyclase (GGDEF)-like protein
MPSTSAREARTSAERIRKTVAGAPLDAEGTPITQTVSIGVSTWDGLESPESLERRADHAMYEAKRAGRNRVAVAGPPATRKARRGRQDGVTRAARAATGAATR